MKKVDNCNIILIRVQLDLAQYDCEGALIKLKIRWKIIIPVLLILILLTYIGYLYHNNIINGFRGEIVKRIEDNYQIELNFSEINIWPLNQLIVNDLEIIKKDRTIFSASELKIYYQIIDLIKDGRDLTFDSWLSSLNYIDITNPEINLTSSGSGNDQNDTNINLKKDIEETISSLKDDLAGVRVHIEEADICSELVGYHLCLNETSADLEFSEEKVILKAKTDLNGKKIKKREAEIEKINIDNLELEMKVFENKWQVVLNSTFFDIRPFNEVLENNNFYSIPDDIKLKDLNGRVKSAVELSGRGSSLEEYKAHFDLRDLSGLITYNDILNKTAVDNLNGQIEFDSREEKVFLDKFNIQLAENNYIFAGYYDYGTDEISASLNSYNFSPAGFEQFLPQLKDYSLSGEGRLGLEIEGSLRKPVLGLDFYLPKGNIADQKIKNLKTDIRYRDGFFYVDLFNIDFADKSSLMVDGIYNYELKEYNFSIKGEQISSQLISDCLPEKNYPFQKKMEYVGNEISFGLTLSGKGFARDDFNLLGNVEFDSPSLGQLYTELWFGRENIVLDKGFWKTGSGNINFFGQIDLARGEYDLDFDGTGLSVAFLKDKLSSVTNKKYPDISGNLSFVGDLSGQLTDPVLDAEINIKNGKYSELNFGKLVADLHYKDRSFFFKDLEIKDDRRNINGELTVELKDLYPYLEADFSAENISYSYLQETVSYFTDNNWQDVNLPIKGLLDGEFEISGKLQALELKGKVVSNNTSFTASGTTINPDKLSLVFDWTEKNRFSLENLLLKAGKSQLKISGLISANSYNLDYQANLIDVEKFGFLPEFTADIETSGKVKGKLQSPVITGSLGLTDINYKDLNLNKAQTQYTYSDKSIKISKGLWQLGESDFTITGKISSLFSDPVFDLTTATKKGNIDRILKVIGLEQSFKIGYLLSGRADIDGDFDDLKARLNFEAYRVDSKDNEIAITGLVSDNLDLKLIGSDVKLDKLINQVDLDLGLSGKADFYGMIKGPLSDFTVDLTTDLKQVNISGFSVSNIKGDLFYKNGGLVNLHQQLDLVSKGSVSLDGTIDPFSQKMNLKIISEKLPLNLLKDAVNMVSSIEGTADGIFKMKGTFANPELSGNMNFRGDNLDLGLPEKFNVFSGELKLNNNYIDITAFSGKYASAEFSLDGKIYPFELDDFWDLSISGKDLPFAHGSFAGNFDTEKVTMTGALKEPLFEGDLKTHHFTASMPFKWPKGGGSSFEPSFELDLIPGEEVFFKSKKNIDVKVQKGELKLIYKDKNFQMDGELTSRRGVFEYYNNKFILETAAANFQRFQGVVPDIHVTATTIVDGVRIKVRLDGPADNMIVTFTSQPDLSEKKILTLLTQKGGMGEFITGEGDEKDVTSLVKREFIRMLQSTFQLDFISDLEEKLEDTLKLDRIEINTYELGWNDEITIRLGKNITDNFYLEYSNRVTADEIENEISFNFSLTEISRIEGRWLGDNNFSLSIDTTLEF